MSTFQSAPSALAGIRRLKVSLHSCNGIPHNRNKIYAYYVSFGVNTPESKAVEHRSRAHPVSAQDAVVWLEEIYFDFSSSSVFDICLYEVHRIRDKRIAQTTMTVPDLWDKDEISLSVLDDKNGAVCTLRLRVAAVEDVGRAEMDHAVAAVAGLSSETRTGVVISKIENPMSISTHGVTSIGAWGPLFEKMQLVADVVHDLAEVHPYTKVAWGVISAGYEMARKQKERDENVGKLIEALCSAYDTVLGMEGLKHQVAAQIKTVAALIKNTISCGHFIESYLKKGFWGRAVRGVLSSTDKDIEDFVAQFEQLQRNLTTFTTIATQHHVQAILGSTERIGNSTSSTKQNQQLKKYTEDTVRLARMPFTATARWRSGKKCLPGTRQELISRILDWAHLSSDDAPRVLLLTGVAGVGKSSVANTIASHFQDMSCLAASYCFDRNNAKEHRPELLIPNIAHQLASAYPAYKHALASMNGPDALGTPDLDDQFENLLRAPLAEQTFAGPLFVVVDALDESASLTDRAKLLTILADRFVELPSHVRLFLTSRPEEDIQDMLGDSKHVQVIQLDTKNNDDDIKAFVASKLVDRKGKPLDAFSSDHHTVLASKAEGLFQWAAVVCTSITQGKNPNLRPSARQMRETYQRFISLRSGALDTLYDETLLRLFPEPSEDDQLLARVLGLIVTSQQPLSATSIFELLQIPEDDQESCLVMLQSLSALLTGVLDQNEPIRTIHSSFRDYLSASKQRFFIDQDVLHCDTTIGCLRVLNAKLKFNMCGIETSYVANEDIPDMAQKMGEHVAPSLSYAAQFWGCHLQYADTAPLGFMTELDVLLREKFLFWLELLSVMSAVNAASPALDAASVHITTEDLKHVASDCRRFVRTFGQPISRAAPHVYLSAYAFVPATAIVQQQTYSQYLRRLPKLFGGPDSWPFVDLVIHGHTYPVSSVVFSPDSRRIVSGSYDWTIRIWDAETSAEIVPPLQGHTGYICSVVLSSDGIYIVSGSDDKTVRVWDARTGDSIGAPVQGHTEPVKSVAISLDGRRLLSGSDDKTVRVWDRKTGAAIGAPLKGHTASVLSVGFSPDGRRIISGSADKTVRVWDTKSGVTIYMPVLGHTEPISTIAFSPNGRCVVSGSDDSTIYVWDAETGATIGAPLEGHSGSVFSVAFSPDSCYIVSGSRDYTVRVWDAKTGTAIGAPLEGHTNSVLSVAFSPDGRRIVSGSFDETLRVWNTETDSATGAPLEGHTATITSVAFSPDGRRIVSSSGDKTVRIWDTQTGTAMGATLRGHTEHISSVAISPDGLRIISGSHDKTVRIWDAATGDSIGGPIQGHTEPVTSVAFSPNGDSIVSGSGDMTVRLWHAETGAAAGAPFEAHTGWTSSVAFSPDGRRVMSVSQDRTVRFTDSRTGAATSTPLEDPPKWITSMIISPNGRYVAAGSYDRMVRVWDSQTGAAIGLPLKGHTQRVNCVAFSPDSRRLVSGSHDKTVRIWDAETGSTIGTPFRGHTEPVMSVAFSNSGHHVVSGSRDRTIRIWVMDEHDLATRMRAFSADKKFALQNYPSMPRALSHAMLGSETPLFRLLASGWVEDVSCNPPKLLLWIPVDCRRALYLPPTSLIISSLPVQWLDLRDFAHGARWTECYIDRNET